MEIPKRFTLSTLISVALIIGFAGFSLGFNYPQLENYWNARFDGKDNNQLPPDLNYASVEEVYDLLKDTYAGGLEASKLLDGAKKGLIAAAGDPYTVYLTADEAKEFRQDLDGTFSGIGAEIAVKNGRLVVVAPLEGSPAKAAGLRSGDRILAIAGEDTTDMSVDEAVSKIRGEAGSKVKLNIASGNGSPKEVEITRSVIEVPALQAELKSKEIGYIELVRFGDDAAQQVAKAATDLKSKGAKKFILDLRNNPGGLLEAAVEVSDEFLDIGKVVVEERKDSEVIKTFRSTSGGAMVGLPVVVLINEGSASASEIVAGALMENQAATVIGETTFGKGSVQELVEADNGAYLKVTVARWYTPKGNNISEGGITPDIKVILSNIDFDASRDPQLARAIKFLED